MSIYKLLMFYFLFVVYMYAVRVYKYVFSLCTGVCVWGGGGLYYNIILYIHIYIYILTFERLYALCVRHM